MNAGHAMHTLRGTGRVCGFFAGTLVASALAGCLPSGAALDEPAASGRLLLEQYGCGNCHVIPGVRRANGQLGPTLERFAHRAYIAGEQPNHAELLVRWIQRPSALVPDTLMPDQQVPRDHARNMGAYLMSLR
jgi:cytochrome c